MTIEIRCSGTMHAKITETGLEIKCKRRTCGSRPGVVVLHTFDPISGELLKTERYADLARQGEKQHAPG
jgi:hypothetical protein